MRRLAVPLAVALSGLPLAEAAPVPPPGAYARPPIARSGLSRRRFVPRPFMRRPGVRLHPPPLLLPSPPPETFVQPLLPEPAAPPDGAIEAPPLAHGFHLTVAVGAGAAFDVPASLGRYVDVGRALGACFVPPPDVAWGSITLRASFRRDGSVLGDPRVPYSDAATPEQKTGLARSLLAALKRCTPLHLSPSLGGAIAGEIFAIRFIHQDKP